MKASRGPISEAWDSCGMIYGKDRSQQETWALIKQTKESGSSRKVWVKTLMEPVTHCSIRIFPTPISIQLFTQVRANHCKIPSLILGLHKITQAGNPKGLNSRATAKGGGRGC